MLTIDEEELIRLARHYPGFADMVRSFERGVTPHCPACGSSDTASVQVGVIVR